MLANELAHPAIVLQGAIAGAMADAMRSLLEAGGFRVEVADEEYRPYSVRVISGPV